MIEIFEGSISYRAAEDGNFWGALVSGAAGDGNLLGGALVMVAAEH